MPERKFKVIPVTLIAVLLAVLGLVAYALFDVNRPVPRPPLPNPNGYDDFVKAGEAVIGEPGDYPTMSREELASLVQSNSAALNLVREGLARKCRSRTDFSTANFITHLPVVSNMKRLAQLLAAEGRLAEMEHRTNSAAGIYLELIRFGNESCRGGLVIDRLAGIACEAIGASKLRATITNLDARHCRTTAVALEQIETRSESAADTLGAEEEWVRRNGTLVERLAFSVPILDFAHLKSAQGRFVTKAHQEKLRMTQLMVGIAARAYELEHGQSPRAVNDLLPDYLKAVPVDPTTGTNLTYLP